MLEKYALLGNSHRSVCPQNIGVFDPEALSFLKELHGRWIKTGTREQYFLQFVLQGIVVMVQQGNAAAELGAALYTDNVHA